MLRLVNRHEEVAQGEIKATDAWPRPWIWTGRCTEWPLQCSRWRRLNRRPDVAIGDPNDFAETHIDERAPRGVGCNEVLG